MDSLVIIIVTLVVIARCWKTILTILAGICATFLGGALVGLITGTLTHKYLDGKYPDETLNRTPEPEDGTPCTSPKPPLSLTASARKARDSPPSSSSTGGPFMPS